MTSKVDSSKGSALFTEQRKRGQEDSKNQNTMEIIGPIIAELTSCIGAHDRNLGHAIAGRQVTATPIVPILVPPPVLEQTWIQKGDFAVEEEQFSEAEEFYTLALDPTNGDSALSTVIYLKRSIARFKQDKFESAFIDLDLVIDPNQPDNALRAAALYIRGRIHSSQSQWELAILGYEQALKLKLTDPSHELKARNYLGVAYQMTNEYAKSIQILNELIQDNPEDKSQLETAYRNRAIAHQKLGELDEAIRDFTESSKLNPTPEIKSALAFVLYSRARLSFEKKEYVQSLADLELALVNADPSKRPIIDLLMKEVKAALGIEQPTTPVLICQSKRSNDENQPPRKRPRVSNDPNGLGTASEEE